MEYQMTYEHDESQQILSKPGEQGVVSQAKHTVLKSPGSGCFLSSLV